MIVNLKAFCLALLLALPLAAAQGDRSHGTFLITGMVLMQDGSPCPEPVEVLMTCSGAVRLRVFSQTGGQFSFQLADNKSPNTDEIETAGSPSGGFGSFNRLGRGFGDNGSFGSGRTSKFGRINLTDCEVGASLPGFSSSVTHLGNRDVMDNPDIGGIVLSKLSGVAGSTISLKTLTAPPDALEAYQRAGRELRKEQPDYGKATRELKKAVDRFPGFAAAWNLLGGCHLAGGDEAGALRAFEKAVEADPDYLLPYMSIAEVLMQRKEFEESSLWSSRALERNPDLVRASYLQGYSSYSLGRLDVAEAAMRRVKGSKDADSYPGSHYLLGLIWAQKGQLILASKELNRFLELAPEFEGADQIRQMVESWRKQGYRPGQQP